MNHLRRKCPSTLPAAIRNPSAVGFGYRRSISGSTSRIAWITLSLGLNGFLVGVLSLTTRSPNAGLLAGRVPVHLGAPRDGTK